MPISQEKRKLRDDLSYLRKNKLSLLKNGVYTGEDYLKEESELSLKLEKLRNEEEVSDVSMQEVVKDVVFLSELLEDAYLYYLLANPTEKQEIIRKVFSELTLSGETLQYKCRSGFKALESKKTLVCDPTGTTLCISLDFFLVSHSFWSGHQLANFSAEKLPLRCSIPRRE